MAEEKTDIIKEIRKYVSRKIEYFSANLEEGYTKAQLANLRRGIGKKPGELPELWGSFLVSLPEQLMGRNGRISKAEWAIYTSLTIYALHQQGNSESVYAGGYENNFGRAVGKLVKTSDDIERMVAKFSNLAKSLDMVELSYNIRNIIQLLKTENIKIDYVDFAVDIYLFQIEEKSDAVRLKWGQDFYSEINKNTNNTDEN